MMAAKMTKMVAVMMMMMMMVLMTMLTVVDGARTTLPSDYRDEKLDDDDGELNIVETKSYFADGKGEAFATRVSSAPRAYVYRDFLSVEECEHLISLAYARVMREGDDGVVKFPAPRGAFTAKKGYALESEDDVVRAIELRVAAWSMLPPNRAENIAVLKYDVGDEYAAHHDYFEDENDSELLDGGQRAATVFMYLSDVEDGGETVFPLGTPIGETRHASVTPENACSMAHKGTKGVLSVKPRRGDAVLLFNGHLNGENDVNSLHAGCPVTRGTKWIATQWMRVGPRHVGTHATKPSDSQHEL